MAIRRIIMIIAILVFLGCFFYITTYYYESYISQKEFEALSDSVQEDNVINNKNNHNYISKPVTTGKEPSILKQYEELYQQNVDLVGFLTIEDTNINYPVMQSTKENGEYYLYRNFNKEESKSGIPFLDIKSSIHKSTDNWIIYGHNMKNRTMFGGLKYYQDKSYYEEHPIIKFNTIYEEGNYEIIAAFRSKIYLKEEEVFKYYKYTDLEEQATYDSFIENIKELAYYDTGITTEYGDQLLTLSTCDYLSENGRFVVVARKVNLK